MIFYIAIDSRRYIHVIVFITSTVTRGIFSINVRNITKICWGTRLLRILYMIVSLAIVRLLAKDPTRFKIQWFRGGKNWAELINRLCFLSDSWIIICISKCLIYSEENLFWLVTSYVDTVVDSQRHFNNLTLNTLYS